MKIAISGQNTSVGTATMNGYWYPCCILVRKRSGTGTTASSSPNCAYFCTVKSRIRIPIVRDPKK